MKCVDFSRTTKRKRKRKHKIDFVLEHLERLYICNPSCKMSLNELSETMISNIDLYFPNMSIYFTPGDSVYSVYSDPEYISYKVVKLYQPKLQVINKNTDHQKFQWEFYGQLKQDKDGSVGDYLLYVMNDNMEYSLRFISDDMGLMREEVDSEVEVEHEYEYGTIEIAKELYRAKMY